MLGDVKRHLAIVPIAYQHTLDVVLDVFFIHPRNESPCILCVVDIKTVYRADDGTFGCLCHFALKQCLVAQMQRKSMSSRHLLAEASKVFHIVATADGIIHQQAIVGKVVFVHGLKDSWEQAVQFVHHSERQQKHWAQGQ